MDLVKDIRTSKEDIRPTKCRCLFGAPDREELQETLQLENETIRFRDMQKWNFDFVKEEPLNNREGYQWVQVSSEIPGLKRKIEYVNSVENCGTSLNKSEASNVDKALDNGCVSLDNSSTDTISSQSQSKITEYYNVVKKRKEEEEK